YYQLHTLHTTIHSLLIPLFLPHITPSFFFFFNDPATTEIYTLSLHDALPIFDPRICCANDDRGHRPAARPIGPAPATNGLVAGGDRKSTRLNSSHVAISYAVFCLKKKKKRGITIPMT